MCSLSGTAALTSCACVPVPDPAHAVGRCSLRLDPVATVGLDASTGSGSAGGAGRAGGAEGHPMPEGFREEVLVGCGVVELKVGEVDVKAWSPDSPWLYTVVVSLLDDAGMHSQNCSL